MSLPGTQTQFTNTFWQPLTPNDGECNPEAHECDRVKCRSNLKPGRKRTTDESKHPGSDHLQTVPA